MKSKTNSKTVCAVAQAGKVSQLYSIQLNKIIKFKNTLLILEGKLVVALIIYLSIFNDSL